MKAILRLIGIYYAVVFNAIIPAVLFKLTITDIGLGQNKSALGTGIAALAFTAWCIYLGLSTRKSYLEKHAKN